MSKKFNFVFANISAFFLRKDQLEKKGGEVERASYLQKLKSEFDASDSLEAKQQILANLANFAYDPINYEFLKNLLIPQLFLDQLAGNDLKLAEYAVGGLTNLAADPELADYLIKHSCVNHLKDKLNLDIEVNEELLSNILTILIYLQNYSGTCCNTQEIIDSCIKFKYGNNPRLRNLSTILLENCDQVLIEKCQK